MSAVTTVEKGEREKYSVIGHRVPKYDAIQKVTGHADYMIDLNKRGVEILERFAAIFLTKILGGEDPNFLDIRSPCGAGTGQTPRQDAHRVVATQGPAGAGRGRPAVRKRRPFPPH